MGICGFAQSGFQTDLQSILYAGVRASVNKFAKNIASDDGVFFTPKSLVKMIVNILEPTNGVLLDPACGSGGMFVQTGDFVNEAGLQANSSMTFYGQEKVEYNAQLCLMNMAVHGLTGVIKSGDEANSFYHDAHNLEGCCNYVMANGSVLFRLNAENTDFMRVCECLAYKLAA